MFCKRARARVALPRWMHLAVLPILASVGAPRTAHAEPDESTERIKSPDTDDSGVDNALLMGSAAVNAGFVAFHLRRRLVDLKTQRFGTASGIGDTRTDDDAIKPKDWLVLVKVIGPPIVVTSKGDRVFFDKGKALELLVWMTEHRETSTRSAARTALWDGEVKDSTFSNVVSDVRRSLNSMGISPDEDWIPRTFTDELPLHPGILTDAQLLESATRRFECDRERYPEELIGYLRGVRNLPFSGADYAWADGEGITTSHVIKVVKAAVLVGEYAIERNDEDLLFMATERGLRVLPGHEELVSLRMRSHARNGNRTAIKYEWESYARSVEADSWAGAVLSPKLEELARELSGI